MLKFKIISDKQGNPQLLTPIKGKALLTIPQLNKGTAFTLAERGTFELLGKLPMDVETLDQQVERAYLQYQAYDKLSNKNILLNYILNTNQILFYKLVKKHLREMLPTIYTPIVGSVVKTFNKKFMHPRGLYLAYPHMDRIAEILDNRSHPEIKLIVVSDGEGVLGIGDQGVGGMAIPVAKLMVYTAVGGINPMHTLPILLDAGTNNQSLLDDPLYLGWRHPRISGAEYQSFIDEFIRVIKQKFPDVFLHWEDFGKKNAQQNLIQHREALCSFNDDIQGTGVVTLAAILSAVKQTKQPLTQQRFVVFGPGTAGMGITEIIYQALIEQGLSAEEAHARFWLVDRSGLLTEKSRHYTQIQQPYLRKTEDITAWPVNNPAHIELQEVIEHCKPSVLIGCSAQPGAFTQGCIEAMANATKKPLIFPLSNPTERAEATPEDILQWSNGKALVATGSPFDNITYNNQKIIISQCNNYLAFPGIGLGIIAVRAKSLSDNMLMAAAKTLSEFGSRENGKLLPNIEEAQAASRAVAIAVAATAVKEGLAGIDSKQPIEELIDAQTWEPHYLPYVRENISTTK